MLCVCVRMCACVYVRGVCVSGRCSRGGVSQSPGSRAPRYGGWTDFRSLDAEDDDEPIQRELNERDNDATRRCTE